MARQQKLGDFSPARNRPLPAEVYTAADAVILVTLRAERARPFSSADLADKTVRLLREMRLEYGCWVGAYCLMPDHLHFVAGPREEGRSVLTFVDRFKGKSTNESWRFGWQGPLWQKRRHDHVVRRTESLETVHEYILNNPVRAGLVEPPDDWPWSGIVDA